MQRTVNVRHTTLRTTFVLGLLALVSASGCAPAVIGAGATVGVAAAQERSVGNALDDATIQLQINQMMLEADRRLFADVSVEVVEGRVLLTGAVPNPEHRVEAVRIAWQVNGVSEVLNEIQIAERGGIGGFLSDVRISGQLRFRMLSDRQINDINYSIESVNGVIYLMGIARDQTELDTVINYARSISGVTQVVNHVRLRDDPRRG
ncbi:MAG: BON domain-containing protein [Proteobacteria bacterium]|nr:BON domain-containing protein [Pseudomonadota bacterium]MDA1133240.1 BON domain-containing protein [Pseudomonadota bacterium]